MTLASPGPATIFSMVATARAAQSCWAETAFPQRLRILKRFRHGLAEDASAMAQRLAVRPGWTVGDKLSAEILPLLEACRFLERTAEEVLRRHCFGWRGRPLWLFGAKAEVRRDPLGLVLIVAPANYPLFLPGVQLIQALLAGNAALVKPAPESSGPLTRMAELLAGAGLPEGLVMLLDESRESIARAIEIGVDKVFVTGSAETGRAVRRMLVDQPVPSVMELSGNDAVFVLPGADLAMVADALLYGLRLNGGATCIAPRRVFADRAAICALLERMKIRLSSLAPIEIPAATNRRVEEYLTEATQAGCRIYRAVIPSEASDKRFAPVLVEGARPGLGLLREDIFAPIASFVEVQDMGEALTVDRQCPFALGASVFGPEQAAYQLAKRIDAGSITVNDLIVPTADPRLPFAGRGASGYGATRGGEGLLEMTALKTITRRKGRFRPHFEPPAVGDSDLHVAFIAAAHGRDTRSRWHAGFEVVRRLARRRR